MARNRKSQNSPERLLGAALKAGLICTVLVVCGVGYVWEKQQINVLAEQIGKKEARLRELHQQNDKLNAQLRTLLSPEQLDRRVKELKLGLGPALPTQVWWLPKPADAPPAPAGLAGQVRYAAANGAPRAGLQ